MSRDNSNIEEKLSAFLDGELNDRQQNEIKRLVDHDRKIASMLLNMTRQKNLLGALPVEKAPATLLNDIKSRLERKLILDDYPQTIKSSAGERHLMIRKILTSAAMILVPLGLLVFVLFHILAMPSDTGTKVAEVPSKSVVIPSSRGTGEVTAVAEGQSFFCGILELGTEDLMGMYDFLNKAILDIDLYEDTVPLRKDAKSVFVINSEPMRIKLLLNELASVWSKFTDSKMTVFGQNISNTVIVQDITLVQAVSLLDKKNIFDCMETARAYAGRNSIFSDMTYAGLIESSCPDHMMIDTIENPIKPILTNPNRRKNTNNQDGKRNLAKLTVIISSPD